ncbi:threonine-phosphate decarboxylase CobD [Neobacillus dielmonensis]|uniref:threonine-phosphate decarboxylase CobD n=1 Tax=Neobacillus dielmonensis TaxID=1347369 RepID=UPI0005A6C91E|nr:threonine-phosphate decarboxylase CobD [Neobacillus dielmonensis]
MKLPSHGSNPHYLYEALGLNLPEKYIDFSANINPLGPPVAIKENWSRFYQDILTYPDPFATKLKQLISEKEDVPTGSLLMGNGGAELIALIGRMLAGKKVLIVQPAFSEYETACKANQCEITYYQLFGPDFEWSLDDFLSKADKVDAVFICSPNNPTGIQFPPSLIEPIVRECEKHDCTVILDEAFYDFLDDYQSFIPYINQYTNLMIIRSMTKMYAIPGIRLGYLAASPSVITKLGRLQPHWSINSVALSAGLLCMEDESFVRKTIEFIRQERERLFYFYQDCEFQVSPSKVNFYLLRDPYCEDQFELFCYLLQGGIIPRHTFNFPGLEGKWLRFAIKSKVDNDQLMEVLEQWRMSHPSFS